MLNLLEGDLLAASDGGTRLLERGRNLLAGGLALVAPALALALEDSLDSAGDGGHRAELCETLLEDGLTLGVGGLEADDLVAGVLLAGADALPAAALETDFAEENLDLVVEWTDAEGGCVGLNKFVTLEDWKGMDFGTAFGTECGVAVVTNDGCFGFFTVGTDHFLFALFTLSWLGFYYFGYYFGVIIKKNKKGKGKREIYEKIRGVCLYMKKVNYI